MKNLENTGTPFDYGKHDEWQTKMPAVGFETPSRNQIYTEKDRMPIKLEKGEKLFDDE